MKEKERKLLDTDKLQNRLGAQLQCNRADPMGSKD